MLSRLRQPLHRATHARALFSTETDSAFPLESWTVSQRVAGAASNTTETINIQPDGQSTVVIFLCLPSF